MRRTALRTLAYTVLAGAGIIYSIPFFWMLTTSLKTSFQAMQIPPEWIPDPFVWDRYARAFQIMPFGHMVANSVVYTGAAVVGQVPVNAVAAFAFARIRFRGRRALFVLVLSTMMLPTQVTLIPQFIIFKNLGLLDTLLPLIVRTYFGTAFHIFLLGQLFMTLPIELDEAAMIDGATPFDVLWRVILPLARPAFATVAIFSFVYYWNDFFGPLIYLTSPEQMTIAVGLQLFRGSYVTDFPLLMAASTAALLPVVLLFFFTPETFIQGIALTGLKG